MYTHFHFLFVTISIKLVYIVYLLTCVDKFVKPVDIIIADLTSRK